LHCNGMIRLSLDFLLPKAISRLLTYRVPG
jgi:hypothetical protein